MDIHFEWDPDKAEANFAKHRVSFKEARTVFSDPLVRYEEDREHSYGERRFRAIGWSEEHRILVVVYTYRGDVIRLISARTATRREVKRHEA